MGSSHLAFCNTLSLRAALAVQVTHSIGLAVESCMPATPCRRIFGYLSILRVVLEGLGVWGVGVIGGGVWSLTYGF